MNKSQQFYAMRLFAGNIATDKRFVNAHVSIGPLTETVQLLAVLGAQETKSCTLRDILEKKSLFSKYNL